jgi:hypothetical protein
MGVLIIACPRTNKPVDTGLSMPIEMFEAFDMPDNEVECPHCGETHVWSKEDAIIVDGWGHPSP